MKPQINTKEAWDAYCATEIGNITPILLQRGYTLDTVQPHIQGERFLMHAVTTTSGYKVILLGRNADGTRVVIKGTSDLHGKKEILHERKCRDILSRIDFARDVFHTPQELAFIEESGYTISIQHYIEQQCTFLERTTESQFDFALTAFKGQEGAHATTHKHRAHIGSTFSIRTVQTYLNSFIEFRNNIAGVLSKDASTNERLTRAFEKLTAHERVIEQYTGFLTHTDFVPHNFRIDAQNTIYLLDHSSLTFGNKYEGWARFINFMTLYNPILGQALEAYVRENRSHEEVQSLRMMRLYRLTEIIWYYVRTFHSTTGNLLELNMERVFFWSDVLDAVLHAREISPERITAYTTKRDLLRTTDEKIRQQGLH